MVTTLQGRFEFAGKATLMAGVVIFLGLLWWCSHLLNDPKEFPIKTIHIEAPYRHVHKAAIRDTLMPLVSGSFFTVNVHKIKEHLLALPWVGAVSIRRIWPNQLNITIEEKHPIARWDRRYLLTADGSSFIPNDQSYPDNLPNLQGPTDQAQQCLQAYKTMSRQLDPLSLQIVKLQLTKRQAWELTLDNGARVNLGREDVPRRLVRFVHYYQKVFHIGKNQAEYIDLRYPNGMAVKWDEKA